MGLGSFVEKRLGFVNIALGQKFGAFGFDVVYHKSQMQKTGCRLTRNLDQLEVDPGGRVGDKSGGHPVGVVFAPAAQGKPQGSELFDSGFYIVDRYGNMVEFHRTSLSRFWLQFLYQL